MYRSNNRFWLRQISVHLFLIIKYNNVCGIWNACIGSFVQSNIIFFNRFQNFSHFWLKAFNSFFNTFIRCFFIFNWTNWSIWFWVCKNLLLCIIRWRYLKNDFLFETILPSDWNFFSSILWYSISFLKPYKGFVTV